MSQDLETLGPLKTLAKVSNSVDKSIDEYYDSSNHTNSSSHSSSSSSSRNTRLVFLGFP